VLEVLLSGRLRDLLEELRGLRVLAKLYGVLGGGIKLFQYGEIPLAGYRVDALVHNKDVIGVEVVSHPAYLEKNIKKLQTLLALGYVTKAIITVEPLNNFIPSQKIEEGGILIVY